MSNLGKGQEKTRYLSKWWNTPPSWPSREGDGKAPEVVEEVAKPGIPPGTTGNIT